MLDLYFMHLYYANQILKFTAFFNLSLQFLEKILKMTRPQ